MLEGTKGSLQRHARLTGLALILFRLFQVDGYTGEADEALDRLLTGGYLASCMSLLYWRVVRP
jgi:hypothetical protein